MITNTKKELLLFPSELKFNGLIGLYQIVGVENFARCNAFSWNQTKGIFVKEIHEDTKRNNSSPNFHFFWNPTFFPMQGGVPSGVVARGAGCCSKGSRLESRIRHACQIVRSRPHQWLRSKLVDERCQVHSSIALVNQAVRSFPWKLE